MTSHGHTHIRNTPLSLQRETEAGEGQDWPKLAWAKAAEPGFEPGSRYLPPWLGVGGQLPLYWHALSRPAQPW